MDNDDIKLIVVDEPSSALDPIAERNLFETFMAMRQGRTVIFVTHRFKHLVDHADLILLVSISAARPLAHIHVDVWQMELWWSAGLMPSSSRHAANTRDYTMLKSKFLISNSSQAVSNKTISPKVLRFLCPVLVLENMKEREDNNSLMPICMFLMLWTMTCVSISG